MSVHAKKEGGGDRKVQVVTVRMPTDVYEALRTLAFATDTSINELVLRGVADFLANEGHREAVDALADRMREQYGIALDKLAHL